MTNPELRSLTAFEIEQVTGANGPNGVVAGPNGEGCTEPHQPIKEGQELSLFNAG